MNILIDFDGTFCKDTFPEIGKSHELVLEWAYKRVQKGDRLYLWTLRRDTLLQDALHWLKDKGIEIAGVVDKFPFDVIVDDKMINPTEIDFTAERKMYIEEMLK